MTCQVQSVEQTHKDGVMQHDRFEVDADPLVTCLFQKLVVVINDRSNMREIYASI